jgi:hypothetical protein
MFQKVYNWRILLGITLVLVSIGLAATFWLSQNSRQLYEVLPQHVHEPPLKADFSNITAQASGRVDGIISIVLVAMAMTTAGAVAISFYLYRWRKILSANTSFSVPEELISSLNSLGKEIRRSSTHLEHAICEHETSIKHIADTSTRTDERITEILETSMLLQRALDERDAEIRRLRQGYDVEVFRRFISRFLRVKQLIDDCHSLGQYTPEDYANVGRLLDDAFEECGLSNLPPQ